MKRFLADAILILILVSIGSYITQKDESGVQQTLEQRSKQFEEHIAQQKEIKTTEDIVSLNDIEDNQAGQMAEKSSEFIVGTIKGTVKTVSDIFEGILN